MSDGKKKSKSVCFKCKSAGCNAEFLGGVGEISTQEVSGWMMEMECRDIPH